MDIIHAIVTMQNWGDNTELIRSLKLDSHVISLFHIMGKHSYLMDVNFDDKDQLENWIVQIKSTELPSGVPAILRIETNRIIAVHKAKENFTLTDYHKMKEKYHFFVRIDIPHHDENLIIALKDEEIVHSILHVQGACSFISEIITDNYEEYKDLLKKIKNIESIYHIETQEVIKVIKYRNQILEDSGTLRYPQKENRELYTEMWL